MTPQERNLAAHLLREASEHYSNHGCNDFDLATFLLDLEERRAFVQAYEEWNSQGRDYDPDRLEVTDTALMAFLAARLEVGDVR